MSKSIQVKEWLKEDHPKFTVIAVKRPQTRTTYLLEYMGEDKVNHYLSMSWMTLLPTDWILKDYGKLPKEDEDRDALEIEYYKEFHKPKAVRVEENEIDDFVFNWNIYGYIAPDGEIYFCNYGEHTYLGKTLCAKYFNTISPDNYEDFLIANNFVVIRGSFFNRDREQEITEDQLIAINMLKEKLSELSRHINRYNNHIDYMLEGE